MTTQIIDQTQETFEFISAEQVERRVDRLKAFERPAGLMQSNPAARSPIGGTLDPYVGPWDYEQATHLLRRAMIGPLKDHIEQAAEIGLDATVATLLDDLPMPDPPLNYFYQQDPNVPIGETWILAPTAQEYRGYRRRSLYAWTVGNILNEGISVRERMTLFWHNHFVTSEIVVPKFVYQYITLLREHALGNFKELTRLITINPSMLIYLNGNQNSKFAPNENYARELLELFTIGKGALAGEGDYTTFTEHDVQEISKILTGWRVRFRTDSGELPMPEPLFTPNRHDETDKQLSHRFNNAVIASNGEQEYIDLLDVIFQHEEAAKYICRKLYRWFVYYKIDDHIEQTIIAPMADILRKSDYEIKPVLEALFKSQHFFDINSLGCIIKNPIEFLVGTVKQFEVSFPDNFQQEYRLWNGLFNLTELLQMVYYFPPGVAGWKAFYQGPSFNQLWINAVTLITRQLFTDTMSTVGYAVGDNDQRFEIDALDFISKIDNALNPNDLISGIARIIYPNVLTQEQIDLFKEILIPGLPDFEWTVEYQEYLDHPADEEIRVSVENKVRQLLRAMMARPEYHLF